MYFKVIKIITIFLTIIFVGSGSFVLYKFKSQKVVSSLCEFSVQTEFISSIKQSSRGKYEKKDGEFVFTNNELQFCDVTFTSKDTAFFVIDPWDNGFSKRHKKDLTDGVILTNYIRPLIEECLKKGFLVYFFTNRCDTSKGLNIPCGLSSDLDFARTYPNARIVYWNEFKKEPFVKRLSREKIEHIIYMGFDSNMCVIGRPAGMFSMKGLFYLYFVPEASTGETVEVHQAMTRMIAQNFRGNIHYKNLFKKMKNSKVEQILPENFWCYIIRNLERLLNKI